MPTADQCFLYGGDCSSCCPQCDITTYYDNRDAKKCICYEVAYYDRVHHYLMADFYGSDHDDCIFAEAMLGNTEPQLYFIYGMGGDDVVKN